jgi:hypothetical protein
MKVLNNNIVLSSSPQAEVAQSTSRLLGIETVSLEALTSNLAKPSLVTINSVAQTATVAFFSLLVRKRNTGVRTCV